MALKGIWQNANGGTRKQNGHWQSSVAAAYNANLRSWGAVNYYSVSGLSSDGANTFINFKAGTWREAWTITARYKTAQIPGRIIFSEDTTGGAWNARTAIRLYSTAARNEFIAAMNAPTVTTIGETVITQTFTLTIPA